MLAGALALVAFLETLGGEGVAMATIERALALEHSPPWSQVLGRPDWIHGLLVGWSGALASAREAFSVLYREALDRGDEHSLPFVLFPLARFEFLMGDWTAALRPCARMPGREQAQRPGGRAPVLARDRGDRRGAPGSRRSRPSRRSPRAWSSRSASAWSPPRWSCWRRVGSSSSRSAMPRRGRDAGPRRRAGARDRLPRAGALPLPRRRDRGEDRARPARRGGAARARAGAARGTARATLAAGDRRALPRRC